MTIGRHFSAEQWTSHPFTMIVISSGKGGGGGREFNVRLHMPFFTSHTVFEFHIPPPMFWNLQLQCNRFIAETLLCGKISILPTKIQDSKTFAHLLAQPQTWQKTMPLMNTGLKVMHRDILHLKTISSYTTM